VEYWADKKKNCSPARAAIFAVAAALRDFAAHGVYGVRSDVYKTNGPGGHNYAADILRSGWNNFQLAGGTRGSDSDAYVSHLAGLYTSCELSLP
jgi:hypothetical protein